MPSTIDPAFTFSVGDLPADEAVRFTCMYRARTYRRSKLIALVGADARLHRELWCKECGEPPLQGWLVSADDARR